MVLPTCESSAALAEGFVEEGAAVERAGRGAASLDVQAEISRTVLTITTAMIDGCLRISNDAPRSR